MPGTVLSTGNTAVGKQTALVLKVIAVQLGTRILATRINIMTILTSVLKQWHLNYHLYDEWLGQWRDIKVKPFWPVITSKQHLQIPWAKRLVEVSKTEDVARIQWGKETELEEPQEAVVQGP